MGDTFLNIGNGSEVMENLDKLKFTDVILANSLNRNGYDTLEKILNAQVDDLLDIQNLGPGRIAKLLVWLEDNEYEPTWKAEFLEWTDCTRAYQKVRNNGNYSN